MAQLSTKLILKKEIADSVYELHFEKPQDFQFQAGQFVQFFIPDGDKQTPRSYSIASTPADEHLEFCVKFLDGGLASEYFSTMQEGDELAFDGPQGRFICNEAAVHHVFVATGTGLAPVMGMLRDELENKKWTNPIDVLFGVRTQKDVFWIDRLNDLATVHKNLNIHYTLSKPEDGWDGMVGRVTDHLDQFEPSAHFYLCGSAPMVMDVRKQLRARECEASHMHFEIF